MVVIGDHDVGPKSIGVLNLTGVDRVKNICRKDQQTVKSNYRHKEIVFQLLKRRSIWAKFTTTRPELMLTPCRGSFTRPMNRNGARQRPYHALTAASSGFIPTPIGTLSY
jgi:hypothetical protein